MERTSINPTAWSRELGFDQGQLVVGEHRVLHVSGQTAMDEHGQPLHQGDPAAQLARSLDNLEGVLAAAGATLADVVRLRVYAVDVDALLEHFGVLGARLAAAGATPTMTVLGVVRLVVPGQVVELEATAVTG